MATRKRSSTIGKESHKEVSTYGHTPVEASATIGHTFAEPTSVSLGVEKYPEPATRRAFEILKPYKASFKSSSAKLTAIKNGLAAHAITDLIEISGATQMDLAHILDLTEPTLRKHIKAGKELNTGLSEHILQLFQLFDKGMDTFGSLQEFKNWLRHESVAFTARPIDLLDTITGIIMVMDELTRIDYGITA